MYDAIEALATSLIVLAGLRAFVRWLDRGYGGVDVYRCSGCGAKTQRPHFYRDRIVCDDCAVNAIAAEDPR